MDGAVWEQITKGRVETRWDNVVENVWRDIYSGKPRRGDVRREVWEVRGRRRRNDRQKGKPGATKQGGIEKTLRDIQEIKRRDRNENVFARPNGLLRENAETAISST